MTVRPVRSFVVGRMLSAVSGRYTNTVAYTFDPAGRKASEALTISTRSYDAGRRQTTEVLGNGITETRSYRSDRIPASNFDQAKRHHASTIRWLNRQFTNRAVDRHEGQQTNLGDASVPPNRLGES